MNEVMEKELVRIKNIIYVIDGNEMMLDRELSVSECQGYLYDMIVIYCDIGKSISMLINFKDVSLKLERN